MEASELRIGNYVRLMVNHSDYNEFPITLPDLNLIANKNSRNEYYPIPITEEWLLKLGFELIYESNFRKKYDYTKDLRFGYDVNKALKNTPEGISFRGDTYHNIKFVHQLQNLYFALTGEELTLKDKA